MVYLGADALDTTFRALADPTRRAMLEQLAGGDRTIGELATGFAMTLPAVSKHVRVLERAGLAEVTREGRSRRCTLVASPMREAAEWIIRYRAFWEASLDRLARYLEETLTEEEHSWQKRHREPRTGSKSGGASRRRASGSTGRGRKRKH